MNYGAILTDTWKIIWKHKAIPGFGLLAMLVPVLLTLLGFGFFSFSGADQPERYITFLEDYPYIWLMIILVVTLISFLATSIGYAGILKGTAQAEEGVETLSFAALWEAAWPYAGRVAGLLLLISFSFSLVFMIPALLGVLTAGLAFLCLFPLIILMIPLSLLLQAFLGLALAAAVADEAGVFAAIQRGWKALAASFWPVALMSVILYGIQMAASFVLSFPTYFLQFALVPVMINSEPDFEAVFRTFGIIMLILLPLMMVAQGLLMTYLQSAWTLVYLRLTRPPAPASALPAVPAE